MKDVTRTPVADDSTPTTIEPTEPVTSDVSPTGPPAQSTSGLSMVETIGPIESVKVAVSDASPLVYTLRITSVIPVGCVKFGGYETVQEGRSIYVTVTNLEPGEPVPCTTIYAQHQGEVILDGGLTPGEAYSVVVNGKLTNSFTAGDLRGRKMAVAESPVEIMEGWSQTPARQNILCGCSLGCHWEVAAPGSTVMTFPAGAPESLT